MAYLACESPLFCLRILLPHSTACTDQVKETQLGPKTLGGIPWGVGPELSNRVHALYGEGPRFNSLAAFPDRARRDTCLKPCRGAARHGKNSTEQGPFSGEGGFLCPQMCVHGSFKMWAYLLCLAGSYLQQPSSKHFLKGCKLLSRAVVQMLLGT